MIFSLDSRRILKELVLLYFAGESDADRSVSNKMTSLLSGLVESIKELLSGSHDIQPTVFEKQAPSRGWGEDIKWKTLEAGKSEAEENWRPMMVVLHWMSCAGCGWMKREFTASDRIRELSENFVMVNLLPEEIPRLANKKPDPTYAPDGYYVPRILFFSPEGKLLPQIKGWHGSTTRFQYTYPQAIDIIGSMQKVSNMRFERPKYPRRQRSL